MVLVRFALDHLGWIKSIFQMLEQNEKDTQGRDFRCEKKIWDWGKEGTVLSISCSSHSHNVA